jgi:hypothetical protein
LRLHDAVRWKTFFVFSREGSMQPLAQLFHSNEGLFRARKKNSQRFLAEGLIIAILGNSQ